MEVINQIDVEKLYDEAAWYGGVEAVSALLMKGVNINAYHCCLNRHLATPKTKFID